MKLTLPPNEQSSLPALELPTVEGVEIRLDAQKISLTNPPRRIAGFGEELVFAVSAKGSSRAVIEKAYVDGKPRVVKDAATAHNAEIAGARAIGYSVDPLRPRDIGVGGEARSGRHTRQFIRLSGGALVTILENSAGVLVSRHPREILEVTAIPSSEQTDVSTQE